MGIQLLGGVLLGVIVAGLSWRAGALNRSGAWASAIVGTLIFGLGGLAWAGLLLTFFLSSSVLSRVYLPRKAGLGEKFSKGFRRDWGQVLANGGMGALLAVVYWVTSQQPWVWVAFAGVMAAVTADTWATELGVLSRSRPRRITSGRSVEPGTSGAVSPLGSLAAFLGSLLIAVAACFMVIVSFPDQPGILGLLIGVTFGGLCGSFFDSFLGATVQVIYYCPDCEKETEHHPLHTCGAGTTRMRGWVWLNNDVVNFFASVIGMLVAVCLWALFG